MAKSNEFEPLTFDEILADKEYQAEFDRRVTKALETQKTKLEEDFKQGLAKAKEEFKEIETEEIKKQFLAEKEQLKEELTRVEKNRIIDKAILKSGTVDEVAVKAHLQSFLKEAEYKDGVIVGLDEQLKELKENKEHLFKNETVVTGVKHKKAVKTDSIEDELRRSMGVKPKSK